MSVDPGVVKQAVLPPQITALSRVTLSHRQLIRQQRSGCWVIRPPTRHPTCRTNRRRALSASDSSVRRKTQVYVLSGRSILTCLDKGEEVTRDQILEFLVLVSERLPQEPLQSPKESGGVQAMEGEAAGEQQQACRRVSSFGWGVCHNVAIHRAVKSSCRHKEDSQSQESVKYDPTDCRAVV